MTVKRLARALAVAALLVVAGPALEAAAHPEGARTGTTRYVTARVAAGRVEVADVWLVGALPAVEERRRLDADGDGAISGAELETARAARATAPPDVAVTLDGAPPAAPATTATIDLGDDARAADGPLVIERRTAFPLPAEIAPGRPHDLRVALARDPPRALDTEIVFDLVDPGYALVPPDARDRVLIRGPRHSTLEERAATFTFTVPAPPRFPRALVLAALAGLAVLVLLAASKRKRRPQ